MSNIAVAIPVAPVTPTTEAKTKKQVLPGWINARAMSCVWAVLVVYGTLVPFEFISFEESIKQSGNMASWLIGVFTAPQWFHFDNNDVSSLGTPNWVNDLWINIVLYSPLGLFLRLDAAKRGKRWAGQMLYALGSILLLSWVLECTQGLMEGRVGSLNDIVTNCIGGLAGAMFAIGLCSLSKKAVFKAYCKLSYVLYHLKEFLIRQRRKPVFMFLVVASNVILVLYWYVVASAAEAPGRSQLVNWLPFTEQFKRSYDVAAVQIGRSLVVYCLFSMILSLQFMRAHHRKGLGWIVLIVAVLAVAREVIEFKMAGISADITEPIIGVMAVGFIITTACLLVHAVRCSCRRKKQVPVEFERRKIPFQYDE